MSQLMHDVRYALRGFRRSPGFTLVAMLTLALGIGVNAAIFGMVNAILYRPLPVERPGELVDIYSRTSTSTSHTTHSYPDYLDYRAQTTTLDGLIGYTNFFAHAAIGDASELVIGELVTDNYFGVLGVVPRIGRSFTAEEFAAPGASPVAVLSHALWQRRFGGDSSVAGTQFRMNGRAYTVVGVAPESFAGMMPAVTAQMWIPAAMADEVEPVGMQRTSGPFTGSSRLDRRAQHWLWLRGRMAAGATPDAVRAEFAVIAGRLAEAHPTTNAQEGVAVIPTSDVRINPDVDRAVGPVGLVLLVAVGFVLAVVCANLANLMLARAAGRRREFSLRVALGANRTRLIRQLLTESTLLALGGGLVAVPLAAWLASVVMSIQPPLPLDIGLRIAPDWRVLVYTLLVALGTGILIGVLPAWRASRLDIAPALKEGGEWVGGRKRVELRDGLVVAQVAVSLMLVIGGALLVRSLSAATRVDLGYDADRLGHLALALEMNGYDEARGGAFLDEARRRLEALPQVGAVALTSRAPLSLNSNGFEVVIDGHQSSATDEPYAIAGTYADEHYIDALGLGVIEGRGITLADRDERRRVAVITEAMAARYWPGERAVGRNFRLGWDGAPYEIVGVVADYKVNTPGERPEPYMHFPMSRQITYGEFVVSTTVPAGTLVPALEREVRALDPGIVFLATGTLRTLADVRLFPVRAGAWLIGAFGLLALVVAAIGLYGVIGYSVARRVREIGIRKALGAAPGTVVSMVLREGMILVTIGGIVGGGLAAVATRAISSALYVGPLDPASFAAAFGILAVIALIANGIPAWRAAKVDAMVALRHE